MEMLFLITFVDFYNVKYTLWEKTMKEQSKKVSKTVLAFDSTVFSINIYLG